MMSSRSRRTLLGVLVLSATAVAPSVASASTFTVDDDRHDCPNAAFGSIQAAVDQAAPRDTVVVCPGVYLESSIPIDSGENPVQPGARNGLTIDKPLTLIGAGADKVFIEPDPSLGSSLAGTAPYLRDGGGNVITVSRQSLGATDADENRVDISGVTVAAPFTYAEAGIAFFNTSGSVVSSMVGPIQRANADELASRPHGYGIIQTNSLIGAGPGSPRREVTVQGSLVTGYQAGGVLFDDSIGGADGAPNNINRSGINMFGYIVDSRIVGGGQATGFVQNGVRYQSGARGSVTGSDVVSNAFVASASRRSAGLLLADADLGTTDEPAFTMTGSSMLGNSLGTANTLDDGSTERLGASGSTGPAGASGPTGATGPTGTTGQAQATQDYWGCVTGPVNGTSSFNSGCQGIIGSVNSSDFQTTIPAALSAPAPTPDSPPSARISEPLDGTDVAVGDTVLPVVRAGDDFGVRSVTLAVDGATVATGTRTPYEFSYTVPAGSEGRTLPLVATVTDSSGQSTTTSAALRVRGTPDPPLETSGLPANPAAGPAGPAGPAGAPGAPGAPGSAGPRGLAGISPKQLDDLQRASLNKANLKLGTGNRILPFREVYAVLGTARYFLQLSIPRRGGKTKTVTLGKALVTVSRAGTRTVRVRMSAAKRRTLRRHPEGTLRLRTKFRSKATGEILVTNRPVSRR